MRRLTVFHELLLMRLSLRDTERRFTVHLTLLAGLAASNSSVPS
jgi:hypothetical protein